MHPVLMELGPIAVHTYGVFAAIAVLVAVAWAAGSEQRAGGIGEWRLVQLAVWTLLGGFVAARLPLLLAQLSPRELLLSGGFFDAGVIGGALAVWWWSRRSGVSFLALGDRIVPAVPLAQAIGRVGCFSAGCCFGAPTQVPWAVAYQEPRAQILAGVPLGVPLHPAPLYALLAQVAILLSLAWFVRGLHRQQPAGSVLALWAVLEGVSRVLLDGFRGDPRGFAGPVTLTSALGLALSVAGLAGLLASRRIGFAGHPTDGARPGGE